MYSSDQEHDHASRDTEMQNTGENQNTRKAVAKNQELQAMLKKLEENLHRLGKQAFVLANLYYFFQGAILTAVSQVSAPKCHQWHFFSVLSAIPFLLNGIPLIYTMCKYAETKNESDMYKLIRERQRVVVEGSDGGWAGPVRDGYRGTIRYIGVVVGALFLVGFNAAILYGSRSLLCQSGDGSAKVRNVAYKCFSLCNSENRCLNICTS